MQRAGWLRLGSELESGQRRGVVLGAEDFEEDEHRKFGEDGFEVMVERVAGLERALGIYDLAKFTPR